MVKNSNFFKKRYLVRFLLAGRVLVPGVACLAPAVVQAQAVSYAGPLVITKGGTYTGNYRSLTSDTPCVRVATSEPVVLDGCQLAGAGNLIEAGQGVNLTVRNCRGQALTPTVDNQTPGRFLDAYMPQSLVVEHNAFTGTTGIGVNRWSDAGTSSKTLTVRYNQARNIDGRWRNGGGTHSSFVLLNTVQHLAGVDVAYNEVINAPDQSLVEDNINLFNSSGTASSPLHVHDNFVRGAYPIPAVAGGFTGSGMTTDGNANTAAEAAAYIEADHNQFLSTGNAAMNIAAGHDVYYHDNRLVSSGYLADGRQFLGGYVGLGVFNFYNQPAGVFGNNRVENNTIGFVRWGGSSPYANRQDEAPDACAPCTGTIHLPNPITPATEDNEWQLWQQKLQQNGVVVGPTTGGAAPTPPPATAVGTVANPGFEADGVATGTPTGWQKTLGAGTSAQAAYTESYTGGHTGTYHGTHYRPEAYEAYTYQVVTGLAAGTYSFSAWVKSSGGQAAAQLRASNYGGPPLSTGIGATTGGVTAAGWALVTVPNIAVANGQCEIGFYSNAAAGGQAIYFDDAALVAQGATPVVANSLLNTSFDDDRTPVQSPQQWTTKTWGNTPAYVSYTEAHGGAHTGTYHGTHYSPDSYRVYTYQTVSGLPNGTYTLSAWIKSSGGQPKLQLQASNYGKGLSAVDIAATPNGQWAPVMIPGIVVSNGQCEVGFYSQANQGGQALYFDDVALVKQETSTAKFALSEAVEAAVVPTLYPNPANDQITITTSFAQASEVTLVVTDLQGTLLAKYNKQAVAGSNQFSMDTSNLPSGIYILQILSSETSSMQHLEVQH